MGSCHAIFHLSLTVN